MMGEMRAADLVMGSIRAAGNARVFTLSGNQILSLFDASIDAGVGLIHVRHEAAAVHMADAWGRLTGQPGVALVSAGPGLANCLSALYVARMAEAPLVLVGGQAALGQQGRGAFQEMAQAEMVRPVTKASWVLTEGPRAGQEFARAVRLAGSGRPGPVYLGVPVDVLESSVGPGPDRVPPPEEYRPSMTSIDGSLVEAILEGLAQAEQPLLIGGPAMMRGHPGDVLASLSAITHVPFVGMESPRGVNDPSLGALAGVLRKADLVVLLGKKLDFTLRRDGEPAFRSDCRFIQVDPDEDVLELTRRGLPDGARLVQSVLADPTGAGETLVRLAGQRPWGRGDWEDEVRSALAARPEGWKGQPSPRGPLHPAQVCQAIRASLAGEEAVVVADGGEFGQWAQAFVPGSRRIINGPSGAIGGALPFALGARLAFPKARVVALLGDGTFGFHPLEFDTAVRYQLPFVAVVGNDAAWNAEYQMQVRHYGADRAVGCELSTARYDEVVRALGGHGEHVAAASDLSAALKRAFQSRLPACVNVTIGRHAAPTVGQPS